MAIDRQKRKRFIGTPSSPPRVRRRRCVTGWRSWVWSVLPVQTVLRQWTYRKSRVVVPVIAGLVFVRVGRQEQVKVLQTKGVVAFLRLKGEAGAAVIPDKQMEDFRFLLDFSEEAVEMTNENIKAGDLVRVVKGSLRGMEGELIRHKGVTKVLVRIDMLGCAMVNIPASFVEKLNK